MNAVMEEAAAKFQEEVDAYVMPKPMRGQAILWYPNGVKTDHAEIGFVLKSGRRSIELRLAAGLPREAVRNINDPKLQVSDAQRENGAWDFTDKDKAESPRDEKIADLAARISKLETALLSDKELEGLLASNKKKVAN